MADNSDPLDFSSNGSKENLSMPVIMAHAEKFVRKTISDYWAVILGVTIIFGWIFTEIYNHHGRISKLEGKIEMMIERYPS